MTEAWWQKKDGWKDQVAYQIYPRSFKDSNGDGIGDIPGIIEKLDYLQELGIGIIWLSPVFASPMDDNGYDISDYRDIAKEFGTMGDMDCLIQEGKKRGIGIMMDLVVNHSSDEHDWFQASKESMDNPYRDYYIWREGDKDKPLADGRPGPPNDLTSFFSGSAWEWEPTTGQYYLHLFTKKQPDLNWDNPLLRRDVYDMMNWWMDKGICGFRMDVIDLIGKDVDRKITTEGPELHPRLQEMHGQVFVHREAVTVGETWSVTPETATLYSGRDRKELSMVFQFEHVTAFHHESLGKWQSKPVDFGVIKDIFEKWQLALEDDGWNSLFWSNHDLPRAVSKYGNDTRYRKESAKMLATMIHFMKGTPYVYQGEEFGMTNVRFDALEDYNDVELLNAYKDLVPKGLISHEAMMEGIYADGRDNARTPMQWTGGTNAGFTRGAPWLKINPNHGEINATKDMADTQSIFRYYQKLIGLRKEWPVVVHGSFKRLLRDQPNVFVYTRTLGQQTLVVIINHTSSPVHLDFRDLDQPPQGDWWKQPPLVTNYTSGPQWTDQGSLTLSPYESLVYALDAK